MMMLACHPDEQKGRQPLPQDTDALTALSHQKELTNDARSLCKEDTRGRGGNGCDAFASE